VSRTWTALSIIIAMAMMVSSVPAKAEVAPSDLTSGIGRFGSIICVDIDSDGRDEIVFGSYEGFVVSAEYLGGDYRVDWRSDQFGTRAWGLEAGQFDGDPAVELIIGDGDGNVRSIDGRTKEVEWESETLVRDADGLCLHDLDSDGKNELIVGTGFKTDQGWGQVYYFRPNSSEPYRELPPFDSRLREIAIADLDDDGDEDMLVCSGAALGDVPGEGYFRIFDPRTGELEFKSEDLGGCTEGMKVSDLDGDGSLEIVLSTGYRYREGYCYIYSFDGEGYSRIWRSENIGPKAYGLDVSDIDGDDVLEIVVSNMAGRIFVYDGITRQREWTSGQLGRDILGLTIGDPDGDGEPEIVAAQGGYIGKGDYTSGYTTPHVYILDGRTKRMEAVFGEEDPLLPVLKITLMISISIAIVLLALIVRVIVKARTLRKGMGAR